MVNVIPPADPGDARIMSSNEMGSDFVASGTCFLFNGREYSGRQIYSLSIHWVATDLK